MTNVKIFKQDGSQNGEVTLNETISELNQMKMLF